MASRTSTDPLEILIEMGVDLDDLSEQDYLGALMEAIATIEFQTKGKGDARSVALREEVVKERKRRRENPDPDVFFGNKPDYIQEKRKKISADSFKKGSATSFNFKPRALPTSSLVPYQAPEVEEEGGEKKKRKPREKNLIAEIAKSVVKISDILKQQYNVKKKSAEFDRKKAEQEKRVLQKSKLSKGFEALVKGAQKVIAPVQSLLSRVFGFLFNLLLGKFIMKLLDWIGDPKNREKFNSVVRFLKDNWPKLIALYLVFGNSIGRFIFNLTKTLIGGAVKLTAAIAKLLAAKKLKGARGVARFLGKRGGLIGAGLATAATVGGAMALTDAVTGGGEEQQTQAYSGGGVVSSINIFGKSEAPAKFDGGGKVDGPSGIDKVPAMLTSGEFVMSRGAVQKIGVGKLEAMNAAGGGTNRPKVVNNKVYASVGGYIGKADLGKRGTPDFKPSKESSPSIPASAIRSSISSQATKRHAELMKSTDQKKIADYDAKHGAGAYSEKLQEKLNKIYPSKAPQPQLKVISTGKVVGRENLSPQAQEAIARLEAKRGLPPDMQYTRNGKRISAEEFNRIPGMGGGGGGLNALTNQAKVRSIPGMLGSLFDSFRKKKIDPQTILEDAKSKAVSMATSMGGTVRDGNVGIMTPELQKAVDRLNANRARADKREAESKAMMNRPKKRIQDDPLFAEYDAIQNDPHHPLFEKVRGGGDIDDFGMRFSDFKKFKAQQSQAKLSTNQPQPKISAPQPPTPPSNNVQVIKSGRSKGGDESQQSSNGSELPAINAGNGSKSKFTLLGISF